MSFSWMKPAAVFLSRALTAALTLSIAFQSTTNGFVRSANAEPIYENSSEDRKTRVSYAQELSEVKESIIATQEEIDSKNEQLKTAQDDLGKFKKWENYDEDDAISNRYSPANCECSPKTQCKADTLIAIGAIGEGDIFTRSLRGPKDCGSKPATSGNANLNAGSSDTKRTGQTYNDNNNESGSGGGNSASGKEKCVEYKELKASVNKAAVCKAVYDQYLSSRRDPYSSASLQKGCIDAAKACGPVKWEIEKDKLPKTIDELQADIKTLEKERKKLVARRQAIDKACPDCSAIAQSVDSGRPGLGDYIVGGLQAVSPMVIAGIQASSYNRYLKTSLTGYNNYLGNSLASCQAYISQGTTLGIPSTPCQSAMWSGGIAQAPGGGGFGIYGGMGMGGGVGGMFGYPGGYAGGYGSYGYGGFSGVIGSAIGGMYGGSMGGYSPYGMGGQIGVGIGAGIGGMYGGPMAGGYSPYGMGGQIGVGIGAGIGGGYAPMGGFSPYGMGGQFGGGIGIGAGIGGGYAPMGGYSPYGIGGQFGGGIGGIGIGAGIGAYGPMGGGYVSTMGIGGSYSYGVDPSYQLNAERAQMQQQNMQISRQQMTEAQYRYQQASTTGYGYGGGIGGGYGYGGGYGVGVGGYGGYGGYGYGGGTAVIGSAIGSLYGVSY